MNIIEYYNAHRKIVNVIMISLSNKRCVRGTNLTGTTLLSAHLRHDNNNNIITTMVE
jgi:hypothetical protein